MADFLKIRGAREHNLKNVNLDIPKNKLVVFTGLSGSGKSSLAFDTIYAEGQRRYVESLSSYARQFLGVMNKPDLDHIEGLSPAISIDQKSTSHNPRSTVGTVTEIYDYLRLLYARVGHPHCPKCGREITRSSVQQITDQILEQVSARIKERHLKSVRLFVLSPVIRDRKGEFTDLFSSLRQKGFTQVRVDGKIISLSDDVSLYKNNRHTIDAVVDRLVLDKTLLAPDSGIRSRIFESVETSAKLSDGLVTVSYINDASFDFPKQPKDMEDHLYSEKFSCPVDNISLPEIEPRMFSFNSPQGACPTCTGLGTLLKIDEKLILKPNLTISEGGILPYANTFTYDSWFSQKIGAFLPIKTLIKDLSSSDLKVLLYGNDDFEGIIPNLERRYKQTQSEFIRTEIEKYMRKEICPSCNGDRLKPESLKVTINDSSIVKLCNLSILDTLTTLKNLSLSPREITISKPILKEICDRLSFLDSVGLDYLTLNRTAATLAGGESQRIRLASQIGSGLSGVLYVLDEPSIGLHQRDNQRLIDTLKNLRDLGNSVVVVEHDREIMLQSDWLIDFGPGAGDHGGKVISEGSPQHVKDDPASLTGKYLSGKMHIEVDPLRPFDSPGDIVLKGASEHNLKKINVSFPLGRLICIAGVSGSGKSTLLIDILYQALAGKLNPEHREKPGQFSDLTGTELIDRVIMVDQSPIGRTPRSNPATYTGLFTPIREIFALTPEARIRGYNPGRFSFNVKGGRCENCQGEGQIKIEMQFLPDVYVNCEICGGTRYNSETLEVHFKDKNISEVLNFTVEEAADFFSSIPVASEKLRTLKEVGLDYIRIGQPAPTLSGGEAQRVKLATELSKRATGKTLYILDEPTTGLHFYDLQKLMNVLRRLVNAGNTVAVIEHNLDVIGNSDWIIELGPGGGESGGEVIATGTPKQISQNHRSVTGPFLRETSR